MTQRGFTLIELAVVIAVISVIAAVAAPYLMPAILFSRLEGAARHAAGYGRSALAYAALMREPITVKFDLKKQEYWCEHKVQKENDLFDDEDAKTGEAGSDTGDSTDASTKMGDSLTLFGEKKSPDEAQINAADDKMRQRLDAFVRTQLEVRAKQIKKEGILDEVGPLFEGKKFSLEDEQEEIEELKDPILERTKLPQGVVIESVLTGGTTQSSGEIEVELLPTGMVEPVTLYFKGENDEYYTVTWDPIICGSKLEQGKQTPEERDLL
jgi:prepilin-type N-terminal cleavage/methylation domain-containing protein